MNRYDATSRADPHHRRDGERGSVTMLAMFMAVLMAAWATTAISANLNRRAVDRGVHERSTAIWLAESGISLALYEIEMAENPRDCIEDGLAGGAIQVTITESGADTYVVKAKGMLGKYSHESHALVKFEGPPGYRWALFAHDELKIQNAWVDSYNGGLGSYESQLGVDLTEARKRPYTDYLGSNANLGSNQKLNAKHAAVRGHVYVPPGASASELVLDSEGTGSGLLWDVEDLELSSALESLDSPVLLPPVFKSDILAAMTNNDNNLAHWSSGAQYYVPEDVDDPEQYIATHPWSIYYPTNGQGIGTEPSLEVDTGDILVLPAGTYFMKELKVKDGGRVIAQGDVRLWIEQTLDVDDGTFVTQSGSAGDLEVMVGWHNRSEELQDSDIEALRDIYGTEVPESELWPLKEGNVRFKHNGVFIGTIYAPTSEVKIESQSDVCGSIIARKIEVKSGGAFHFDESLEAYRVPGRGGAFIVTRW